MRNFLMGMWGIMTPVVHGETIQILTREKGQQAAARLWVKFFLSWALVLGPLLMLKVVSALWLRIAFGALPALFAISPIVSGLDVYLFYTLPGIRLEEEGMWVKDSGKMSRNFYRYQDVKQIHQLTMTEKKREQYQVEVTFLDGSKWHTEKRPKAGIPFLIQLSDEIKKKCDCPISPMFDILTSHESSS